MQDISYCHGRHSSACYSTDPSEQQEISYGVHFPANYSIVSIQSDMKAIMQDISWLITEWIPFRETEKQS